MWVPVLLARSFSSFRRQRYARMLTVHKSCKVLATLVGIFLTGNRLAGNYDGLSLQAFAIYAAPIDRASARHKCRLHESS